MCLPSAHLFWIGPTAFFFFFFFFVFFGFFFFFFSLLWHVLGLWCCSLARFFPVPLCRSMWCARPVFIRAGGLSRARRGTDIHSEWRPLFSFCQRAPRLSSPPLPVVCGRQGCGYPARACETPLCTARCSSWGVPVRRAGGFVAPRRAFHYAHRVWSVWPSSLRAVGGVG